MPTAYPPDKLSQLKDRFAAEVSWREGTRNGAPSWYAQLLNELVLATGDDEVRYFSAKYSPQDHTAASLAVVAFTDAIVAYANFDGDGFTGAVPLEVIVTARKSLSSFSIETFAAEGSEDGLDSVRVSVNYPEFSRTLPLGESEWKNRGSETADLITRLRHDLVA